MSAVLGAINHFVLLPYTSALSLLRDQQQQHEMNILPALSRRETKCLADRDRDGRRKPLRSCFIYLWLKDLWLPVTFHHHGQPLYYHGNWKRYIFINNHKYQQFLGSERCLSAASAAVQSRLFLVGCKTPKYRFLSFSLLPVSFPKCPTLLFVLFLPPTNQFDSWWLLDAQAATINHLASVHLHSDRHKQRRIIKKKKTKGATKSRDLSRSSPLWWDNDHGSDLVMTCRSSKLYDWS